MNRSIKMKNIYVKSKEFIYKNARPLDLARFRYHFESGDRTDVLDELAKFQNEDGGFGHALEPDFWNPNSNPIATWAATEILREIGFDDASHPLVVGILRYLDSGADFDAEHNQWLNVVPTNNDYPHAIWWSFGDCGSEFKYNPSACLAGFILRFAPKDSSLYEKGAEIAKQAVAFLEDSVPFEEQHVTSCFVSLYHYLTEADVDITYLDRFKMILQKQVEYNICKEPEKWFSQYLTKPSEYITSKDSPFYSVFEDLVLSECEMIIKNQQEDGGFPVMWKWWTDYEEFETAKVWWQTSFAISNLRFLREFENYDFLII